MNGLKAQLLLEPEQYCSWPLWPPECKCLVQEQLDELSKNCAQRDCQSSPNCSLHSYGSVILLKSASELTCEICYEVGVYLQSKFFQPRISLSLSKTTRSPVKKFSSWKHVNLCQIPDLIGEKWLSSVFNPIIKKPRSFTAQNLV